MAALADATDLGSVGTPRAGSSPVSCIKKASPLSGCFFLSIDQKQNLPGMKGGCCNSLVQLPPYNG